MTDRTDDTTLSALVTEQGEATDPHEARVSVVFYHRDGTKVVHLQHGTAVVVGRAWPADVVVRDLKLSRRHAMFLWFEDEVTVEDLGSTNGTLLNGRPISRAVVRSGDEVGLGSVTALVNLLTPREEAALAVESHDRFSVRLEDEVVRARTFGRPVALLMIRIVGSGQTHVRHVLPRLREVLRPVDFVGLYGPGTLLVGLPELDTDAARSCAASLVDHTHGDGPRIFVGISCYPASATSAEAMVSHARLAAGAASPDAPVRLAESAASGLTTEPGSVVVGNARMHELYGLVGRVARSSAPVLVTGETGTGKELIARALHQQSPRCGEPLCAVNCGAIPTSLLESTLFGHERGAFTGADRRAPGLFEQADGGTVFLDEVGELSGQAQAALLRVMETRRLRRVGGAEEIGIDVRIVAATHRDIEGMCDSGAFRLDLYYRLTTITIEVPPLRERLDELEPLVELFAASAARDSGLAPKRLDLAALDLLRRYSWPGNVRELRNVVERAVVIADGPSITVDDLPQRVRGGGPEHAPATADQAQPDTDFKERVRQYETDLILDALRRSDGNQTQAAKLLRMPLRTLVHKIKAHGIQKIYGK